MKNILIYSIIVLYLPLIGLSLMIGSVISIILCSAMLTFAIILERGWYLIEPIIFKNTNVVEVIADYQLFGDRKAAIRQVGGVFYATCAACLNPSKIKSIDIENLENIIQSLNIPFKIALQVEQLNTSKLLNNMKTKQYMKESELYRLSKSKPNDPKISAISREISQISSDISEISSGKMPLKLAYYLLCSARGDSALRSQDTALGFIKEVTNAFDSIMNARSQILYGDELLRLLRFDSTMLV